MSNERWSPEARTKFTSPEYRAWTQMKQRCGNPNHPKYDRYGARGIVVCEEWATSFGAFLAHVGPRPSPQHSIDRTDNDGNYAPGNVRWSLPGAQSGNRSTNRPLTAKGRTRLLGEWAEELGCAPHTIADRLERGWSIERAVTTPPRQGEWSTRKLLTYRGRTQHLAAWARETGLAAATITKRLKRGWTVAEAISTPSGG